jgi:hypothetical protein
VPPLYSVVLRPGDTSGADNVFTSWTALYAACAGIPGGVRVVCDDSLGAIHVPAGAYVISGWLFESVASFVNANGGAIVTWDDGATIVADANGNISFAVGEWLYWNSASATKPVITLATGECNVQLRPFSAINSLGAHGFFSVTGAAASAFLWLDMRNASLGDSTHPTILLAAGAAGQVNMVSAEIHTLALQGAGIAGLNVFVSYDSNVEYPNAPTFRWGALNEDAGTTGDTPPTPTAGAQSGGGTPAISANANANAGAISITPGVGVSAGEMVVCTFARPFNVAPRAVVIVPADAATANALGDAWYVSGLTAAKFAISVTTALAAGTKFTWYYHVLG